MIAQHSLLTTRASDKSTLASHTAIRQTSTVDMDSAILIVASLFINAVSAMAIRELHFQQDISKQYLTASTQVGNLTLFPLATSASVLALEEVEEGKEITSSPSASSAPPWLQD